MEIPRICNPTKRVVRSNDGQGTTYELNYDESVELTIKNSQLGLMGCKLLLDGLCKGRLPCWKQIKDEHVMIMVD